MKLPFHSENAVQVLLRFDELLQVIREDLLGLVEAVRKRTDIRIPIQIFIFLLLIWVVLITDGVRDLQDIGGNNDTISSLRFIWKLKLTATDDHWIMMR